MTVRDLAKNKLVIAYLSGFSLLGILLFFNLKGMYSTSRTRIVREVAQQQNLAVRSISQALEDDFDSMLEDLDESGKYLTGPHSNRGNLEKAVHIFFSKARGSGSREGPAFNSSIMSVRWLDASGDEKARILLNGRPSQTTDTLKTLLMSGLNNGDSEPIVIGPLVSPKGIHTLWLAVPITGEGTSRPAGILAAEVDFDSLIKGVYQQEGGKEVPDIFIINEHGDLIFSLERPDMYMNNVLKNDPECFNCHEDLDLPRAMAGGGEGWGAWKTQKNKLEYVAFTPLTLGDLRCSIALAVPSKPLAAAIGQFQAHFSAVILLILGLFGLLASLTFDFRKKRLVAEEQARHHQKRAALLRENQEKDTRYFELVETAKDAIYILQGERFVFVNKAFERLHGYSREELLSPDFDLMSLVSPEYHDYINGRAERQARGEALEPTYEFRVVRKDGREVDVEVSVTYIHYNGKPAVQGILRDISEKKKYKEELENKNAELERANAELRELDRLKGNFISTISHELRTPLTSIKASIDMLLKGMVGNLDVKKQEILTICRRNSDRLMTLVNDLLEIQNLESGRNRLELMPLDFDDLIPKVTERAVKACEKKDIRLLTRISPNKNGRIVLGDPAKISHALFNLISNAIKFSDRGTIQVGLRYRDGEVQVSVSDEGIGVPDEMKEKIFERFTQVDSGMTRERGGTGLGLALTRTIVEKHGGRIWVESHQGKGSRFTFTLPCRETGKEDRNHGEKKGSRS